MYQYYTQPIVMKWKVDICQMDVRHGDSALVIFDGIVDGIRNKKCILIDAGDIKKENSNELKKFRHSKKKRKLKKEYVEDGKIHSGDNVRQVLREKNVKHLDAIILSHLDIDHINIVNEIIDTNTEENRQLIDVRTIVFRPKTKHVTTKKGEGTVLNDDEIFSRIRNRVTKTIIREDGEESDVEEDIENIVTPQISDSIWAYLDPDFYGQNFHSIRLNNSPIPNITFLGVDGINITHQKRSLSSFIKESRLSNQAEEKNNLISIILLISFNSFNFYTAGDIYAFFFFFLSEYFQDNNIVTSIRKASHHMSTTKHGKKIDDCFGSCYSRQDEKMQNLVVLGSFSINEDNHPGSDIDKMLGDNTFIYVTNPPYRNRLSNNLRTVVSGIVFTSNEDDIKHNPRGNIFIYTDTFESMNNEFIMRCDRKLEDSYRESCIDYFMRFTRLGSIEDRLSYFGYKSKYIKFIPYCEKQPQHGIKIIGLLFFDVNEYDVFTNDYQDVLFRTDKNMIINHKLPDDFSKYSEQENRLITEFIFTFRPHKEIVFDNGLDHFLLHYMESIAITNQVGTMTHMDRIKSYVENHSSDDISDIIGAIRYIVENNQENQEAFDTIQGIILGLRNNKKLRTAIYNKVRKNKGFNNKIYNYLFLHHLHMTHIHKTIILN